MRRRQFVGTMAHPLNTPRFDESQREVVTSGHGILQPRVSVSLPGTNRSRYARLYGGEPGIDQYTRAVSDVYQDVFDEGSFIGKGIYDVDAFERALKGRFPANRILSHDLLEGCYARAGLLSDAELSEESPARYSADVARRRRWIRGDWQLVGWLRRRVRGPGGHRERNPLSLLSQWKVFDNLRRSLVPAALTALLVLGWTVLPHAWFWTAVVVGILLTPSVIALFSDLADRPHRLPFAQHLPAVGRAARRHTLQALLALALLPYEAFFCLDAIARTIGRMLITHRRLLEWKPSSDVDRAFDQRDRTGLLASYRSMAIAPVIAIGASVQLCLTDPASLLVAGPILLLWAASPTIAWWISRPLPRRSAVLTVVQTAFLHKLARKTWAYFETYVVAEDHWLPPDNVQDHPAITVAHRTSPTNMGLALLANLAAHDFGYLTTRQLITRTANTLRTMQSLERYRGHFYNWYDTQTLLPLTPIYVSTVDSGNLAAHLLTLRPGLSALGGVPILNRRWLEGLRDTFSILVDAAGDHAPATIANFEEALVTATAARPNTLPSAWIQLKCLVACAADVVMRFDAGPSANGEAEAGIWAHALARQCTALRDDLIFFAPWLESETMPATDVAFPGTNSIPTLRELAAFTAVDSPTIVLGRDVDRLLGSQVGGTRCRIDRRDRSTGASGDRACDHGLCVPLRQSAAPAGDRLQRHGTPPRRRPLRFVGDRSTVGQFRRNRAGASPAGKLVRARASADIRWRRAGPAVVERVDVRISDAAAGDADLRQYIARSDVPRRGRTADRLWQATRRAMGNIRGRLQRGRCPAQLSVSRRSAFPA